MCNDSKLMNPSVKHVLQSKLRNTYIHKDRYIPGLEGKCIHDAHVFQLNLLQYVNTSKVINLLW